MVPVGSRSVTFMDGNTSLGTVGVDPNRFGPYDRDRFTLKTLLGPGRHRITAVYHSDDATTLPSTSAAVVVDVAAPPAPPAATGDVSGQMQLAMAPAPAAPRRAARRIPAALTLTNTSGQTLHGPFTVVLHGLRRGTRLRGAAGFVGPKKKRSPFVVIHPQGDSLPPGGSITVVLRFRGKPDGLTFAVFAGTSPK
jgi:hypothetical protein